MNVIGVISGLNFYQMRQSEITINREYLGAELWIQFGIFKKDREPIIDLIIDYWCTNEQKHLDAAITLIKKFRTL